MAIIEISNQAKPVAVALDWHLLPGTTSERKEIDALVKRVGVKFGCVVTGDDDALRMVGLSTDRKEGVNCGAAWLARASAGESIILAEPLADGRVWLCAVRAGLPVQDWDKVVEVALLIEQLREYLSDGAEARLCSTLENLDHVYPNVAPQSFAELVNSTKPEKLRRISGLSPAFVFTAASLCVAAAAWYGAEAYLKHKDMMEARAKLEQMSEIQRQQEAQRIANAQREHLLAGQAKIRQVVLDKPSVSDHLLGYLLVLSDKPLRLAGWELSSYECAQLECRLFWTRRAGGTILRFLIAAEERGWDVERAQGGEATTAHSLQAPGRGKEIEDLGSDGSFRAALESRLQQAEAGGLKYELSPSAPVEVAMASTNQPGVGGEPPVQLAPLPYLVGTLKVRGSTFFEMRELPEYISHPGLAVSSVRGDLKSNQWTMELNYATQ